MLLYICKLFLISGTISVIFEKELEVLNVTDFLKVLRQMAPWYIKESQSVPSQKEKEAEINFCTNLLATSDWPVCMHIALTDAWQLV